MSENRIKLISISLIVLFASIATACALFLPLKIKNDEYIIKNSEMAEKIGLVILTDKYPDFFDGETIPMEAKIDNGTWRVNNKIDQDLNDENLGTSIILGREYYVYIDAKTGEVVDWGVND